MPPFLRKAICSCSCTCSCRCPFEGLVSMSCVDMICVTGTIPQASTEYPASYASWAGFWNVVALLNGIPVIWFKEDIVNWKAKRRLRTSINFLGCPLESWECSGVANRHDLNARITQSCGCDNAFSNDILAVCRTSFLNLYSQGLLPRPVQQFWIRQVMR